MNCINFVVPMNPCRCGYFPDSRKCTCTSWQIKSYLQKISQPMLERMDICVETMPLAYEDFREGRPGEENESSGQIRERVERAQELQNRRYQGESFFHNARLTPPLLRKYCEMTREAASYLQSVFQKMEFSARVYHKILKVGRTIADLEGEERIGKKHIAEAVCYRAIDKKYWGNHNV